MKRRRKRRGWTPFAGPQLEAFCACGKVDVIGYGGAGGGGKTDLELGLALLKHRRSVIYRRTNPQLAGMIERSRAVYRRFGRINEQTHTWRLTRRCDAAGRPAPAVPVFVQFGSMQRLEDREKWRGIPFDFRAFDECQNFLREQVTFTMAWTRTDVPGQHTTDLLAFNPPTTPEGLWLIDYFGPWLDRRHERPARPGEVRWYITLPDGTEQEVDGPSDWRAADYRRPEPVVVTDDKGTLRALTPRSRTFFPARVTDNPVYMETGYMAVLDALPEPLRSQMRDGDFTAGLEDDAWQVIPTRWVQAAMERGRRQPTRPLQPDGKPVPLSALGADVAAGGPDRTAFSPRYGDWFAPVRAFPGKDTPDGAAAAARMIEAMGGERVIPNIDVIGVGQGLKTALGMQNIPFNAVNAAASSYAYDRSGLLKMANVRAEMYWRMREALDPESGRNIALPDDRELLAELCEARWNLTAQGVLIEPNAAIVERLGRSPDKAVAVLLANYAAPRAGYGPNPWETTTR